MENQEGRYVYVLDENNLPRMTYIRTSGQTQDGKWIISNGVNIGDRIITSGLQKVIPGNPIRIIQPGQEVQQNVKKKNVINKFLDMFKG